LIDSNGDEIVTAGDFAIGDGTLDDCNIIFRLNTGALKSDPILGPNLITMINSNKQDADIKQSLALHLARDNKYAKKLDIKNGNITFTI
jgi:hypothetical protein